MAVDISLINDEVAKILLLGSLSFILAMIFTPLYTYFAFKYELWKKPRTTTTTGEKAKIFTKLHKAKHKRLPTMGGIIFVVVIILVTLMFNLSREQTALPLAVLAFAGLVGLSDDWINVRQLKAILGLQTRAKFLLILTIAVISGWYFTYKLGYTDFHMTFFGDISLNNWSWLMVPLFALVVVSSANALNITDGLDGLLGGLSASAFMSFGVIALLQGNYAIAGFCFTVVGALLSFIWFNVHPARFIMGDVGSFALGTSLGVVAMLTNTLTLLPIIGLVFVVEALSSGSQILSKKLRNGKKIFKIAPIHHHFEAMGWPETKVTMRFWIIGQMCAVLGVALAILGGHI